MTVSAHQIRNVAIVAHVDHGKTTLVDRMLYQSGMFRSAELDKLAGGKHGLILDSNPLERERGITILSKNCALHYRSKDGQSYKVNVIDTPGHADFGGEVERVLSMADGVLLLVDAFEGPMPQTRFVLQKMLENALRPIVVVNKVDRPDSRPDAVLDEVFELLVDLGANDEALDFPFCYASGRNGWASRDLNHPEEDLSALFELIVDHVPAPAADREGPLKVMVSSLDYSDYVGRIAIGRVARGSVRQGQVVAVLRPRGEANEQKIQQVFEFEGLSRRQIDASFAGDIVALVGLDPIGIGDTVADRENPESIKPPRVDEPTLHIILRVNDSPFSGQDGEYVTSRQIRDRLERELRTDVALAVEPGPAPEEMLLCGRGLMHLGILLEKLRREGFELSAGNPRAIMKEKDGHSCEPIERLVIDCPARCQSAVLALISERRSQMLSVLPKRGALDWVHMEFSIPARGLIGMRSRILNATGGEAIMHHTFLGYEPVRGPMPQRQGGALIAIGPGQVTPYALDLLADRGTFFVRPGERVYGGQIVGEHRKDQDLSVNIVRGKQLTNMRASVKDESVRVRPPREITLETALEYVRDDELVEITPKAVRLRKRLLSETDRRRASKTSPVGAF